jgi:glucans biosynthesis protein C
MRKNYIDNLRSFVILLLFPFHTSRMYTSLEINYVQGNSNIGHDFFVRFTSTWFMYMLFLLAGISTVFSLRKRTLKQYYKERVSRLLVPLIFGVVLTSPIQTYYAELFHNGYTGSFLHQYIMFFTKETDLTGYTGGFTPAHLWFLLVLFLITLLAYPFLKWMMNRKEEKNLSSEGKKRTTADLFKLISLGIVIWAVSGLQIGGRDIVSMFLYFLIGVFILSKEDMLFLLKEKSKPLILTALVVNLTSTWTTVAWEWGDTYSLLNLVCSAYRYLAGWLMILALLGIGQVYLDFSTKATRYMASNSFNIYFVHQTIMVPLGYYVLKGISNSVVQYLIVMVGTFIMSVLVVEIIKRIPILNDMFGMKVKKARQKSM